MSSEKLLPEDSEDEEKVEMSFWMKALNYIFCRGDLADEKLETKPLPLEELFQYASPSDRKCLLIGVISSCLSGFNEPAMTILLGAFTKVFLTIPISSDEFLRETFLYMLLSFFVFLFSVATTFTQFICFHRVATNVTARIRTEYIRSILRQDAAWFDKHSCGALTTQLNDNIDRIRDGIGDKLGRLVGVLSMLIACMVVSFATDWRIAICLFPVVPAAVCCMNILDRKLTSVSLEEMEFVGKAGTVAEESIFGVKTVQSLNGQEDMVERYRKQLVQAGKQSLKKNLWTGFIMGLLFFILYAFQAGGVMIGGYLLTMDIVSDAGAVVTAVLAMLYASYDMGQITPQLMVILNARVAGAVVYKIIDRIPEEFVSNDMGKEIEVVGDVEFRDVRFSYPTRKTTVVLDDFSLSIPRGCTVALVGHSGCGKSTAISLLCRLYEVETGKVLIDGVDVKKIKLSHLREIVGIVQQEPSLFSGTIRENVTMGNSLYRNEDVERVCQMANAHEFIMQLSQGGIQLSGGQKQRIAIARALIRNPRILLLDEATSALDVHSEAVVQEALDRASVGRTTIVIAHRLSTVVNADLIVVMDKGRVVERGSHSQLIAKDGRYATMWKTQANMEDKQVSQKAEVYGDHGNENRAIEDSANSWQQDTEEDVHTDDIGLISIYSEASSRHGKLVVVCLFVAILHGLEMPGNAVVWALVVQAMDQLHNRVPGQLEDLEFKCWLMAGLGFYYMITSIVGSSLFAYLAERFIVDLRTRTFRNVLHQDAAYFDNTENSPGKIITRLASDASNIQAVVDTRILNVFSCIAAWIVTISMCLKDCWPLGVLFIVLSALLGWFMYSLTETVHRRSIEIQKQNSAGKISVEIIEKVRTIQLLCSERRFYFKYEDSLKAVTDIENKNGIVEALNYSVSVSAVFLFTAAGFTLGSLVLSHQLYSVDDVYQSALLGMIACIAIKISSTFNPEVVRAKTAASLMFRMMNRAPGTGESRQGSKKKLSGFVEMRDVHFSYSNTSQNSVLRGLNLQVQKGQNVAIVGPSGSGKSTVISLLERFYEISDGSLSFDGVNIRQRSLHHLRKNMTMVGQEPRLFSGTIRENICLGRRKTLDGDVAKALRMANAENFVAALPQGIDTDVGEAGTQLSGGQKQRIAIARALIREPTILLLDEATSALDGESEKAVQLALDEAGKGRTCITIAHRLSSIRNSDVIFYMRDGRILEQGTHDDLVAKGGLYYEMFKKQSLL